MKFSGTYNEERRLGEINTHRYSKWGGCETASNLFSWCEWMKKQWQIVSVKRWGLFRAMKRDCKGS